MNRIESARWTDHDFAQKEVEHPSTLVFIEDKTPQVSAADRLALLKQSTAELLANLERQALLEALVGHPTFIYKYQVGRT